MDDLTRTGIVALNASDSHVYWLEYGTRDAAGNYQHDGALMSYRIVDGTTTTVASGLDGPSRLELTTTHAYIGTDGAYGALTVITQMHRVPLIGGSVELLQEERSTTVFTSFVNAGSQAFWSTRTGIYTISAQADAVATLFLPYPVYLIASDGTDLFYAGADGVMRMPTAGAAPTTLAGNWGGYKIALHDDGIFGLEALPNGTAQRSSSGILLSRAPKSGGEFEQVRPLGAGAPVGYGELRAIGDRYFFSVHEWAQDRDGTQGEQRRVLTASFVDDDPPIRLLELPLQHPVDHFLWVGTAGGVYWSDGQAIYEQPLPNP
jgi:hypothetical protein